ncbi:hypothetical protein ALI22I_11110 [Saccharothrix sp. ALI-22-I]|nr:hypothetical protein ALI22I_11110 [Saccharothrix sp. ALI-22-I]
MATPVPGDEQSAAAQPAAADPTPEQAASQPGAGPADDEPAAAAQSAPDPAYAPPRAGKGAVVVRVVKHRATQLVAVGLLGLVIGGGIVAIADRGDRRSGIGLDRSGHSRFDERKSDRFPGRDFERGSERGSDRFPGRDFER